MNDFEQVYIFVKQRLQTFDQPLEKGKIREIVLQTKELLANITLSHLGLPSADNLVDEDWERMIRELEMHFDVKMPEGSIIQGKDQQKRDTKWWSEKEKGNNDLYYWNRYKEYIGQNFAPEVIRTIDIDTDVVMNNIADPKLSQFTTYGMVVGHVQSGKTANYSALISKACDAGYKFIIVIAGGINNLRNQTQVRINEAIIGSQEGKLVGVGKLGGTKSEKTPSSPTTTTQDFNKRDADKLMGLFNFETINVPVIMVIKKNTNTLSNVIKWLKAKYKNKIAKHAMLMIDDESDYASVNTKGEDDPSTINKKLRQLMSLFEKSAYIAYTATPYANIFIDYRVDNDNLGLDLFPKDFIVALNAPDNYFGAKKIFLNKYDNYVRHIQDNGGVLPLKHKKDTEILSIPDSLKEAVRVFLINIAIRNLGGQSGKHNSMLVHVSRFTNIHVKVAFYIEEYLNTVIDEVVSYGLLDNASKYSTYIRSLEETYNKEYNEVDFKWKDILNEADFKWEDILNEISNFIKSIIVREVHQRAKIPLEYLEGEPLNVIAIGGASLSRGYTLEGLSVSYFLRTTKMYDTLMQMGRWFGYRIGYEDICRIYMKKLMGRSFSYIIEATEELFENFRRMAEAKKTPNDFGLSVTQHPHSSLQVTANNKLRHTTDYYFNMNLDGSEKETTCIDKDEKILTCNLQVINTLIHKLEKNPLYKRDGDKYLWKDVDKELIIEFLDKFKVYSKNPVYYSSKMPIEFIKTYALEVDKKWDILLPTGKQANEEYDNGDILFKKEKRTGMKDEEIYLEANQRHISTGTLEKVLFSADEAKGKSRRDLRAMMEKPLLCLHVMDVTTKDGDEYSNVPAFGISFPGDVDDDPNIVKAKVNQVFVDRLIADLKDESEVDEE
ncbi:Z1 domain-containing protein [Vallitalea guaymasensis]|uniref:Z1 domain-containing protein n=1 Tax=Vallitalea guaymasensis TaxID=1185412 RepID=UPI0023545172|nr:Z1 domain-containing protein [Vallitalea guaymasensis]